MNNKQNLHTHTIYCDGKNTPREMVEAAIQKGFDSLGFSGHSYMSFSSVPSMHPENEKAYIREIHELKKEYADRLKIFCGIEYEMYSDLDISGYDYAIGSVHYLKLDGQFVGMDRSQREVADVIRTYFKDDGMAYAKRYYETLAQLPKHGRFDIIGHFDLLSKHSENITFFEEDSKEYMGYAVEAAKALVGEIPFFEVNTGAIARGYRTTPYPSIPITKELKRLGFLPVISSDCHDANQLDVGFAQSAELLKYCGFDYRFVLTEDGFQAVKL